MKGAIAWLLENRRVVLRVVMAVLAIVGGAAEKASWEDADQEELWRTIIAVTEAGDALTLSKTMDGGAVSLTILSGSERIRNYAHGADEIADLLARIRVTLEATD